MAFIHCLFLVSCLTGLVYADILPYCATVADFMTHTTCTVSAVISNCDTSYRCLGGTYWKCVQISSNQYVTGCIRCPANCGSGQYLSTPCPKYPIANQPEPVCSFCSSVTCFQGSYIAGCDGVTNRYCGNCTNCPNDYYNVGCYPNDVKSGNCTKCKVCPLDTSQQSGCTGSLDRVCSGASCNVSNPCTELACSFETQSLTQCNLSWTDYNTSDPNLNPDRTNFLCLQSTLSGTCQSCPVGWQKEDEYCVPCPRGFTCDETGKIVCQGECVIGNYPVCDTQIGGGMGHVTCYPCSQTNVGVNISHSRVVRSGVLGRADLCGVYVECDIGYYLNFLTFGVLQCSVCKIPEPYPNQYFFTTYGVTFGDPFSCMYEKGTSLVNSTARIGFYGTGNSCPFGQTSDPRQFPKTASDCVLCKNLPPRSTFVIDQHDCSFECDPSMTLRAGKCLDPYKTDCSGLSGYHDCFPNLLPWNPVGSMVSTAKDIDELYLTIEKKTVFYVNEDLKSGFHVDMNTVYRDNYENWCIYITLAQGISVQDIPLTTLDCTTRSTEYYNYYDIYTTENSKYVFVFLERQQGYNNRYILWKLYKLNQGEIGVKSRWKLPGKVCSKSSDADLTIMYLTFCNTSWISFLLVDDATPPSRVFLRDSYTVLLGRFTGRLIGNATVGNQDGLRDQALFGRQLSIARSSENNRLWLADELNCRLVEIMIDSPGSFLTYAKTLGKASCYDSVVGLLFPRLLTSVLDGTFFLFLTNHGVYQMDEKQRQISLILAGNLPENITQLYSDGVSVVVMNISHRYHFQLHVEMCPDGYVSSMGSLFCTKCPEGGYALDRTSCQPCSGLKRCGVGFQYSPCNLTHDDVCTTCPTLPSNQMYTVPDSCGVTSIAFKPPCPDNGLYYEDKYCKLCPRFSYSINGVLCVCHGNGIMNTKTMQCEQVEAPVLPGPIPSWFNPDLDRCTFDECQGYGCALTNLVPKICTRCPSGMYSDNRLWCASCPMGRQPTLFQDDCQCIPPSFGPDCKCPDGYEKNGQGVCVICGVNQIATDQVCTGCPLGTIANDNHTQCVACPYGSYRSDVSQSVCQNCSNTIDFAPDPTSSVCQSCVSSCAVGEQWKVCPRDSSKFVCDPCPALPVNGFARYVTSRQNYDCFTECVPGSFFDSFTHQCKVCQVHSCSPGWRLTPCSGIRDGVCEVKCNNITKPLSFSHYENDCAWSCDEGYIVRIRVLLGVTVFECI